jgi:sugar (pentulose or hexulose) kinase
MILGIDLGTGSLKASVIDGQALEVASATAAYPVLAPRPGFAESDPSAWLGAAVQAVRACTKGQRIEAIGLTGQAHGVVLADAAGMPLRPAILWADGRSIAELDAYHALPATLRSRLANPIVVGMAGPSLLWLRANEPEHYRAAAFALQPKDWLRLRLTGTAATDHADASMTLLYDLEAGGWAADTIAALGLEPALLAPVHESVEIVAGLSAEGAELLGLEPGLPVVAGCADSAASLLGNGFVRPGETVVQIGTGMQIMAITATASIGPAPVTHLYRTAGPELYRMAAMQNCGIAFEWARRVFGLDWPGMYRAAFGDSASGDGEVTGRADDPLFLPYLTGERTPHLDAQAAGAFLGLRLHHGPDAMVRAVFDGVAYALADGLAALRATGIEVPLLRLSGGGSADPRWRQMLADVLETPVVWSATGGSAAIGAALLAGVAIGTFPDLEQAADHARHPPDAPLQPRPSASHRRRLTRFREAYGASRAASEPSAR